MSTGGGCFWTGRRAVEMWRKETQDYFCIAIDNYFCLPVYFIQSLKNNHARRQLLPNPFPPPTVTTRKKEKKRKKTNNNGLHLEPRYF